jgi:hypothetical protein
MAQLEIGISTLSAVVLDRGLDRVANLASAGRIEAPHLHRIGQRRCGPSVR